MQPEKHGTNTGYSLGCREDCCRDAHTRQMRNYRARLYLNRGKATIPAIGTVRRIQALRRLGWSRQALADLLGYAHRQQITELQQQRRVYRTTHKAVAALYDELSMRVGPSPRAAAHAARQGWPPPLAWDDGDLDDPSARPHGNHRPAGKRRTEIDPATVERLLDGQRVPSTVAEKHEAMAQWLAAGRSERSLCVAQGWREGRYVTREDGAA